MGVTAISESSPLSASRFHGIHPLKRFKLLQQEKITMESHHQYCLPAKKRVWPLNPPQTPNQSSQEPVENDHHPSYQKTQPKKKVRFALVEEEEEQQQTKQADLKEEAEEDAIICSICRGAEGDTLDPIVFCYGCDLTVHATCYGNPLAQSIPEGNWFCSRCLDADVDDDACCCLCPVTEGAVKSTVDGRWAHILCALLVPEVFFKNPEERDGIDCSRVPPRRWEGKCYICRATNGCAIECSEPKCDREFHVSCGLQEDIWLQYMEERTAGIVVGFCNTHTQTWKKQQQTGKYKIVPREHSRA